MQTTRVLPGQGLSVPTSVPGPEVYPPWARKGMVLKLFSGIGAPGTFSGKMYSRIGAWYWPKTIPLAALGEAAVMGAVNAPWITARISRGGGRKLPVAFITQSLTGLAGFDPNGRQGGRKRQRPLTAPSPFSGP